MHKRADLLIETTHKCTRFSSEWVKTTSYISPSCYALYQSLRLCALTDIINDILTSVQLLCADDILVPY